MNVTFLMVKPPSVKRGVVDKVREMLQTLQAQGIYIAGEKVDTLTEERAKDLYIGHQTKDYFKWLWQQASSGEAHFFLLVGKNAAEIVKDFVGPTYPEVARVEAPGSIRAMLSPEGESYEASRKRGEAADNVAHRPDPKEKGAVLRETKVIFPEIFEQWATGKKIAGEDYDLLAEARRDGFEGLSIHDLLAEVRRDGFEGLLIHVSAGCQRAHTGDGLLCLPDQEQVVLLYEFLEVA